MESTAQTNLKTNVLTVIRPLVDDCPYYCRCVCLLTTTCLIVFEITDKLIDGATAVEYYRGKLFHDPADSVYATLLFFVILGCFVSLGRIYLYFCQLRHYYRPIESHDGEDRFDERSLVMSTLKVVFEAFPQSVIAKFYFINCPIEKHGWGFSLYVSFDFFCGAPFVLFFLSLFWYLFRWTLKRGCKIELNTGIVCVMCVSIITASMGLVFAASSFSDVYKQCS